MTGITREEWQRVKTIALDAWLRPVADRSAYVEAACAGNPSLFQEVESLVAAMERASDRFETPSVVIHRGEHALRDAMDSSAGPAAAGRVGPWHILKPLGRGGMGTVYLAERHETGFSQRAAIKIARGGHADAALQQRFLDERRILARLEHPDIARLIDGGTTEDGVPYVVMEYVDGVPIDAHCDAERLSIRQRVELFRRVCGAVHYAHQHLVVHRDIKAPNILVTPDGSLKLVDFGIAKLLDPSSEHTHTLLRVLTPESASPEQLTGGAITTATDVYALGVLLYRLLSGAGPYGARESETDLIRAICEETPPPPSAPRRGIEGTVRESVPPDLDLIVMKAMRKEPERRYATADQLSDDLGRFLRGRPVLAAPDSVRYRTRKFVSRHRLGVAGAVVLAITVSGGIATTLWQARIARQERERAEAHRARAEREFNAVRGLANAVLNELHDAVVALPGSTKAREVLLRRATEYLDTLKAEAAGHPELSRELVAGYLRLGQVQGASGLPNLGDQQSSSRSYREAASLLEGLGGAAPPTPADSIWLAETYVRLRDFETDTARRQELLERARRAIEAVRASTDQDVRVLSVYNVVWTAIAYDQQRSKAYEAARESLLKAAQASEIALRLSPENPNLSRSLSLNYKNLGATLQELDRHDEALSLYEKALTLDRTRLERQPSVALWKLDLSFSYGSMGTFLMAKRDYRGALDWYNRAVALREEVVAADPDEDFAKGALARGYDRQASLQARVGDRAAAVDTQMRRVTIYERRLKEHPDRANFIRDYASVAFSASRACLEYLESGTAPSTLRARSARRVEAVLDDVARVRARWIAEKRDGAIAPSEDELLAAMTRARKLLQ
jgi:tetratricopeptide (TPR) repeat protein/tRNA A-37 threonylcarbamoyl transferase component Bud32